MRMDAKEAIGSWLIAAVAVVLLVWAVLDFVRLNSDAPIMLAQAPRAAELAPALLASNAIALHRLLPDATDDLGTLVRLDGTVVGAVTAHGVWVRDMRDNVVFVVATQLGNDAVPLSSLEAGDAVRIVGRVARLTPEQQGARFAAAGLVLPETALVIRDVKILAAEDGFERLEE